MAVRQSVVSGQDEVMDGSLPLSEFLRRNHNCIIHQFYIVDSGKW